MVGLVDLAYELRVEILLPLIRGTTQQQPEDPDAARRDGGYGLIANTSMMTDFQGKIRFKPLPGHSMPLLLVNGKIRDEIIAFMPGRLGHRFDDAKVDALFVADPNWRLCVTWLSAPFPTNNLNTLHAQIRKFETFQSVWINPSHPTPSINDDCEYWVNEDCAGMLLYFLTGWLRPRQGENLIYEAQTIRDGDGSRTTSRTIQNLVIDIPVEPDQQESLEERIRCMMCPVPGGNFGNGHYHRWIPSGRRAALILAQSLHKQLLYFFEIAPRWSTWTSASLRLPKIGLESIGTIHLNVAGRLFAKMDLGQILAKLPHNEEWKLGGFGRAEFFQWKRAAEEKRKSSGFPVVEDSIQEHELAGSAGFIANILFARGGSLVREVTIPSEDEPPSATQEELDELGERVAFTGSAVLIQEDGDIFPGNATFYSSIYFPVYTADFQRAWVKRPSRQWCRLHYPLDPGVLRPQDGELVLFTGEAILFRKGITTSIISGQATFYGPAGETITEHPSSIEVVSP